MKKAAYEHVYIAGGYGMIGSNIARQLRAIYPASQITLAGRSPAKADSLARYLGLASSAFIDLAADAVAKLPENIDLIISAVPEP
jgi:saccharopine dehydrogenase-like NADP-dependent oxidoreductase